MRAYRRTLGLFVLLSLACLPAAAQVTVMFRENFDQVPLGPPEDEDPTGGSFPNAFTHTPPELWFNQRSNVPGVGDPSVGVAEWEGWSFANKNFWIDVSQDEGRSQFQRGQGVIAVADPDEWNDRGNPANTIGFYNTFLETPFFDIDKFLRQGSRLQLKFDSSWRPQCCDDGEAFDPNGNNQTASFFIRYADGTMEPIDRWESAPFLTADGDPTTDRFNSDNTENKRNEFFKGPNLNELVYLDLSKFLVSNQFQFQIVFGMENAGDDWWFAMDNMQLISMTEVPGDMDLNGFVDEDDIDDFAQAMHSSLDYALTHFGEAPAIRGSADDDFNFDDIDWFVDILNGGGVAASRDTVIAAIQAQAVPEPATLGLAAVVLCLGLTQIRVRK